MSRNILVWANDWVIEKLNTPEHSAPHSLIRSEVARFISDAGCDGISRDALEDALGDLDAFMLDEYDRKVSEDAAERAGRGD